MKLYTYNKLEAEYTELDKRTLINLLIAGERRNIYVSLSEDNTNDRYYFNRAKDEDIKEFLKPEVKDLKVNVSLDAEEIEKEFKKALKKAKQKEADKAKEDVTLNHDIVIGINKDLELPTVFIDGEEIKAKTELLLHWETQTDKGYPDNKFRIKHFDINTYTHKELKLQTEEDTRWTW